MIFNVPILLIAAYALFRAFEYFALKSYQEFAADVPVPHNVRGMAIHSAVLLPARVFGWGALIWFAYKTSIWTAVKLVAIAFPVSLLFQTAITFTILRLGPIARLICLAAVPILAILIGAFMWSI
jgi:hypothetical protein